jgi:septal ring factor EnvC (AmiA/AmiB activator)
MGENLNMPAPPFMDTTPLIQMPPDTSTPVKIPLYLNAAALFCLIVLVFPLQAAGSSFEDLRENIQQKRSTLDQKKEKIEKLSRREEEIYTNLEKIEKKMQAIEGEIRSREKKLSKLRSKEAVLLKKYQNAKAGHKKEQQRLKKLLSTLWPAYCNKMTHRLNQIKEWSDLDRRIYWLKSLSQKVSKTLENLRGIRTSLTTSLAELEEVKSGVRKELKKTEALKDNLLQERLAYLSKVQEIRAKRLVSENRVREILDTIESLNYKLKALTEKRFAQMKGYLPWPCQGEIEKGYSPDAAPPQRGISLNVAEGTKAKAVFWGKVVHNDTLRGFGKVIILFHGEDYYSLYAFLNSSRVELGQKVEKGETIGICGFYPEIKSEGLYFELRFHQKTINPMNWLSS